jgi:hypothetical protein
VRAPDVVLVGDLAKPKDAFYTGTPILAVEVRGTQSKRYLEEKVKLYIEHDWPCTWIVHVAKRQVEVLRPASAPVLYQSGASIPLPPELDKHGLAALPVAALFDEEQGSRFSDGWVAAQAVLTVLRARGLTVSDEVRRRVLAAGDGGTLTRWLALAATAPSAEAFADETGMRDAPEGQAAYHREPRPNQARARRGRTRTPEGSTSTTLADRLGDAREGRRRPAGCCSPGCGILAAMSQSAATIVADDPTPEPSSAVAPPCAGDTPALAGGPLHFVDPTPGMLALEAAIGAAYAEGRGRYGDEDGDAWIAALESGEHPLCRVRTAASPG